MEDVLLAAVTLGSFVLLFLVAIFADRAGAYPDVVAAETVSIDDLDAHAGGTPPRIDAA